jgi:hypothetical protein
MSTTWVFIGLLAGRELAMAYRFDNKIEMQELKSIGMDLAKVFLGLVVSVILVYVMKYFTGV